jgi:hypothetical protein
MPSGSEALQRLRPLRGLFFGKEPFMGTYAQLHGILERNLSAAESDVIDNVTPGTAAASKAVVLNGSKGIATITSATITTLTSTTVNAGGVVTGTGGLKTKQSVDDVHDTVPTDAQLDAAFGEPATLGRGFIGTIDDADGDTNAYLVFTSDASWYFLKFTKAT